MILPDSYCSVPLEKIYRDDDPDDAFSSVPYEKGFNLLYSLEKLVGEEAFGEFMKAYFNHFKFVTVTSQQFREFFEHYFKDVDGVMAFDWDTWLHKPGLPETPNFDRTLSSECEGESNSSRRLAWISSLFGTLSRLDLT